MCIKDYTSFKGRPPSSSVPLPFVDAYKRLKVAAEVFLMTHCGVVVDELQSLNLAEEGARLGAAIAKESLKDLWCGDKECVEEEQENPPTGPPALPYLALIRDRLGEVPLKREEAEKCYGILKEKLSRPCLLELIWSYWMEEGMLVQTIDAISLRFQNKRMRAGRDPLASLDVDPLRPLNNLLWGYIHDEQHRLSLARRDYEYERHYGLSLRGKPVSQMQSANSRFKFLEAFHNLLHVCSTFFKEDNDTTAVANYFPILNALKEVHLLLAQGAHNQFGDLTSTARMEMLIQQWLMARPEMRQFLGSQIMVPYPEHWMDRVDTMKRLQGWTDVSIIHFRDLAIFGEQILLSIRYEFWNEVSDPIQAANWAGYWRPEIQGYIHAYRAVTGVDLTTEISDTRQKKHRGYP